MLEEVARANQGLPLLLELEEESRMFCFNAKRSSSEQLSAPMSLEEQYQARCMVVWRYFTGNGPAFPAGHPLRHAVSRNPPGSAMNTGWARAAEEESRTTGDKQ